ncbi:MAG: hypothetical protein WD552_02705 [Candidatus Paceibacterota bacterium]
MRGLGATKAVKMDLRVEEVERVDIGERNPARFVHRLGKTKNKTTNIFLLLSPSRKEPCWR